MEKISKVVPSSAKYNIDLSKERPMRSGMPSYGLPVAMSAAQEKRILEQKMKDEQAQLEKLNSISASNLNTQQEIVDQVTLSFKKIHPDVSQSENDPSTLVQNQSINLEQESFEPSEGSKLNLYT